MSETPQNFEAMKTRLDEIADEVSAEGISLDDALALYEEAVKLGLAACDVSEADILVPEEEVESETEGVAEGASPQEDAVVVADAVAVAEAVEASEADTGETPEENSL